jgi:hypothetical protein
MKKNTTIKNLIILGAAFFSAVSVAQTPDTVRVREAIRDTVYVREPAVVRQPTVAPVKDDTYRRVDPRHFELGIRYMPTFGSLALRTSNGNTVDGELTMSHGFGAMTAVNFNRHVGLQAEVNYYNISQRYTDQNLERTVDVSYLNFPVLLSLNTDKGAAVNVNFVAGPQFGLNLGSSVKTNGNTQSDTLRATVAARPGDIGFAYGAGLEFFLNRSHNVRLDLGFRGFYGFVDMSAGQSGNNPDTYNILVKASRKTYGGYLGLTFCF